MVIALAERSRRRKVYALIRLFGCSSRASSVAARRASDSPVLAARAYKYFSRRLASSVPATVQYSTMCLPYRCVPHFDADVVLLTVRRQQIEIVPGAGGGRVGGCGRRHLGSI